MIIVLYSHKQELETTDLKFQFLKLNNIQCQITSSDNCIITLSKDDLHHLDFIYHLKADDQDDILIMFDSCEGKTSHQTWEIYETRDDEFMREYNLEDDYSDF